MVRMTVLRKGCLCLLVFVLILLFLVPVTAEQEPMGYFEVKSNPQGADVLVNGKFAGETPVIAPVRTMNTNGTVIRIMMQGFQIWEQIYNQSPSSGEVVPIQAVLSPVSTVGSLKVSSTPSGAMVTVDNGNGQMAPWTYQDLPTGSHLVSLFMVGYEPYVKTVEIHPGEITELAADMTLRKESGTLEISSDPGGATAYVDGVHVGTTNLVVGNLPPGRHEVKIAHAGNDDYVEWLSVQNQATTKVHAVLKPVSATSGGFVVVTTEPPGASVFLDDEYQGLTETGKPLEISNVTPGSHRIYVSSKNYEDYEAMAVVTSGTITPVTVQMNPSPMPQACGLVIVSSDPAGADIMIDGQIRGTTPATIETLNSGRHTYSIRLAGYQEYNSSLDIIPGQVLQINTVLTSDSNTSGSRGKGIPGPTPLLIIGVIVGMGFLFSRKI
ncbi:MAG: PEGA domain-containing protein [Methanospirillum sp.]|uniref:PEGA domain-containing protein n=1 Tax=Methanospirillum sp. TaxID=45200 RepID=UPI00236D02FC|nr:PEGA domain-containing protein [Methanospirillum sp.]MDD1727945.1 PEGA domain-containing protein [Methanospirillum sp.]